MDEMDDLGNRYDRNDMSDRGDLDDLHELSDDEMDARIDELMRKVDGGNVVRKKPSIRVTFDIDWKGYKGRGLGNRVLPANKLGDWLSMEPLEALRVFHSHGLRRDLEGLLVLLGQAASAVGHDAMAYLAREADRE